MICLRSIGLLLNPHAALQHGADPIDGKGGIVDSIQERLRRGEVLVGDGAMGTMLIARGLKIGQPPETINIDHPEILKEIASLYLNAGADIISTNTFGASSLRLEHFHLHPSMFEINQRAVESVREAVRDQAYVSASIGPTARLMPMGDMGPEEVYNSFQAQMKALWSAGVDLFCIETMTDPEEAVLAIQAARSLNSGVPIMATMTFRKTPKGYYTMMGAAIRDAVRRLEESGADIVGSNCGNGSAMMVEIAGDFLRYTNLPIAIQSNAGAI
jgi:5-methyltetrahydrofolate--homocysteine methyltransferase